MAVLSCFTNKSVTLVRIERVSVNKREDKRWHLTRTSTVDVKEMNALHSSWRSQLCFRTLQGSGLATELLCRSSQTRQQMGLANHFFDTLGKIMKLSTLKG